MNYLPDYHYDYMDFHIGWITINNSKLIAT